MRQHNITKGLAERDADGLIAIDVSFDGMKRGYKSHIGITFAVEFHTGTIVDFEMMCNWCPSCTSDEARAKKHVSHRNFGVKAVSMETERAVRM